MCHWIIGCNRIKGKVCDVRRNVLRSVNDVGAWMLQFQSDGMQDTCLGIWHAPYNGFQKNK